MDSSNKSQTRQVVDVAVVVAVVVDVIAVVVVDVLKCAFLLSLFFVSLGLICFSSLSFMLLFVRKNFPSFFLELKFSFFGPFFAAHAKNKEFVLNCL